MAYYVMELPMVPSGSSYQTGFETGILCAESRTVPGQGRSLCAIDLGQGIKSYACGIILKGRAGDLANSKWVRVVVFSQGTAQGYVNVYSNIGGVYRLDGGGSINVSYGGIYYRWSSMPTPLYSPENTSYEKWPEDCPLPLYDLSETYDTSTAQSALAIQYLIDQGIAWEPPPTDPYAGGGTSGPGGGDGSWDFSSDNIDHPTVPAIGAYDAGFLNIYNPTTQQLQALARYLWDGSFNLQTLIQLFRDPMDCILGLSMVPVAPTKISSYAQFGNVDTGVLMYRATEQFVTFDCGSLTVNPVYGAYLDYSPFTKVEIYLPFIGVRPLDADNVIGKTVSVQYLVDILSGACTATVKCSYTDEDEQTVSDVLYAFSGMCNAPAPVSAIQFSDMLNGLTQASTALAGVASNPTTAPSAISNIASGVVNMMKPSVEHSGVLGNTSGFMGERYPYLIFTSPRLCTPVDQDKLIGYPAFVTATLGDVTGYTEIEDVHLEGIPCTLSELQEIEKALKDGVIL